MSANAIRNTEAQGSVPQTDAGASIGSNARAGSTTTGSATASGVGAGSADNKHTPAIPGSAQLDPEIPRTAKEAPIFGVEASKDVSFKEQVQGHAKYFAGKFTGNDKEVQQGAARARGEEDSLPKELQPERKSTQ